MQLSHATGDQLGELAAEVEDGDGAGLWDDGRGGRPILGRADRGRRVERHLEIGLHLGIVGREHAVARVGGLPVDGLAAILRGPARGLLILVRLGQ